MVPSHTFINAFTNLDPKIQILLFLDSAQAWLLKNVQPLFLGCFGTQENVKKKCASYWLKPQYSPFQIWFFHYIFVNNFSNLSSRIEILLFLDSTKAGLLKNVQNQFSRCFGSRELSKTKVFFLNTLYIGLLPRNRL